MDPGKILLFAVIAVVLIFLIVFLIFYAPEIKSRLKDRIENTNENKAFKTDNKNNEVVDERKYLIRSTYLTVCEQEYFNAFLSILPNDYKIFPQVPLSQIVVCEDSRLHHTELFRILDFCVFDKEFKPVFCIEINDISHKRRERIERDRKVKNILLNAKLSLVTFWTEYGINIGYIRRRFSEYINLD